MEIYSLNAGVSLSAIFDGVELTDDQRNEIEKCAQDGFTEDELQRINSMGVDTSAIVNNSTVQSADKKSVSDIVKELKEKYCKDLPEFNGDKYTSQNPQLKALKSLLDDGLIASLADKGYSKNEIVKIIQGTFPDIGVVALVNGDYECPVGHDDEATAIYSKFVSEILKATSEEAGELRNAQNRLNAITLQITSNNSKLSDLDNKILMLQASIEEKIRKAIDEIEDIAQEQKDEANNIVNSRLDEYTRSKGKMSYDEFKDGLSSDLSNLAAVTGRDISSQILQIVDAQNDMGTLNQYLTSMKGIMDENESLEKEAQDVQSQIEELTKKVEEKANGTDEDAQATDPIGFKDGDVRYDFFVDKDKNQDLSNKNEFLGAENGFEELLKLDNNKDKKVDASELDKNNVKVVVTKADGSQQIKKASEVFSKDDSIDLSSYSATNKDIGNGNKQIGQFNLSMGGSDIRGYQTLDTDDWLNQNYNFTDKNTNSNSAHALDFSSKFGFYSQNYSMLMNNGTSAMNFSAAKTKETISNTISSKSAGQSEGRDIKNKFDKEEEAKAQEIKKEQEEKQAQKAQIEEEKKKKQEEE